MVEPSNGPQLHEIYQLVRENNKMLHAMRRSAFWGGLFKIALYLLALGIPLWLYFSYLMPVVKQMDATLSAATGQKVQLEGQLNDWVNKFEEYKNKVMNFNNASSSSQ
jgi:hypothetical protein